MIQHYSAFVRKRRYRYFTVEGEQLSLRHTGVTPVGKSLNISYSATQAFLCTIRDHSAAQVETNRDHQCTLSPTCITPGEINNSSVAQS